MANQDPVNVHIIRNHVRTKNVLTNIQNFTRSRDNLNALVTTFRPLRLDYDDKGCRFLSDNRERYFEFARWTAEIDRHGRIFGGVLDSEIDILGDESVDELRILASPDGRELRTLEPGRVSFDERPGHARAIMLMTGFRIPGSSVYCFDFSPQFLSVIPARGGKTLLATESWRDLVLAPHFKSGVEASVGSYSLFTRASELSIQLYAPALRAQSAQLDAKLKVETPGSFRLAEGLLTVKIREDLRKQPLKISLPGDAYLRDEDLSYEYTVYRLGE